MRKIFILGFIGLAIGLGVLSVPSPTPADTLSLDVDTPVLDFGRMAPGATSEAIPTDGIQVTCLAEGAGSWRLQVNATDLAAEGRIMPVSSLKWAGKNTNGAGILDRSYNDMSSGPATIYTSTDAEGTNLPGGTLVWVYFKMAVPPAQDAGNYKTTISFSLVE